MIQMKYAYFIICFLFTNTIFSQSIIFENDTLYIKDQKLISSNNMHNKIFIGDTLTLSKPTKKSLMTYYYDHVSKINEGAFVPVYLDDRTGWKIIVEKITDKDNRVKIKGKLRQYTINKKGKPISIGSETAVINDIEGALLSSEIIL